jgi:hypothetical protein
MNKRNKKSKKGTRKTRGGRPAPYDLDELYDQLLPLIKTTEKVCIDKDEKNWSEISKEDNDKSDNFDEFFGGYNRFLLKFRDGTCEKGNKIMCTGDPTKTICERVVMKLNDKNELVETTLGDIMKMDIDELSLNIHKPVEGTHQIVFGVEEYISFYLAYNERMREKAGGDTELDGTIPPWMPYILFTTPNPWTYEKNKKFVDASLYQNLSCKTKINFDHYYMRLLLPKDKTNLLCKGGQRVTFYEICAIRSFVKQNDVSVFIDTDHPLYDVVLLSKDGKSASSTKSKRSARSRESSKDRITCSIM